MGVEINRKTTLKRSRFINKIVMPYTFRVIALRSQWGGKIQKGESFTLVQSSSSPSSHELKKQLVQSGRNITTSSSLPSMSLPKVGDVKESNGWLIELIHK